MLITTNAHFSRVPIIGVRHLEARTGTFTEVTLLDDPHSVECITLFIPGHVYVAISEVVNGDS